jgi:hypothetical protein
LALNAAISRRVRSGSAQRASDRPSGNGVNVDSSGMISSQALARYVLGHRVWLGPHAASHGVTVEMVIDDLVASVPVP